MSMTNTKKIYVPNSNNPYMEDVLYGQPVESQTAPEEVWQGLIWKNTLTGVLSIYIGGSWVSQLQPDWNQTLNTSPDFIKNKPTSMTPTAHAHGNITNTGFMGGVGGLCVMTSMEEGLLGKLITGILPISGGGTGVDTLTANAIISGNGSSAVSQISTASGALFATAANGVAKFDTLPVPQGGTGVTSFTNNSIIIGKGSSALSILATANGALYATEANGAAQFGVLPVPQGGTGASSFTANYILSGNGTSAFNAIQTASGALFATASGGAASFGVLPIPQGGTGATTASGAAENLSVLKLSGGTLTGTLTAREINISSTYILKLDGNNALALSSTNLIIGNSSDNSYIYKPYFYDGTNNYSILHKGNVTYGTGDPPSSGAVAGDIYIKYTA